MNLITKPEFSKTNDAVVSLPTLLTIICHLMTCYAVRPSEALAVNINRHMRLVLTSSSTSELEEFKPNFLQLQAMWDNVIQRHQSQQRKVDKRSVTH